MIYRDKEDFLDEYDNLININNVGYVIQEFQNSLGRLNKLKALYNPKMTDEITVNHAKEIVDLSTSYTYGLPVSYSDGNIDNLVDWFTMIDEDSHNYKLGKEQAIYGKAYELISMDDDNDFGIPMPYLTNLSVFNTFVVKDNTNKHKTFLGVYYNTDTDKQGNIVKYIVTIYTRAKIYVAEGTDLQSLHIVTEEEHLFKEVPIIQLNNNSEEKGDFENVIGLIKAYDALQENRCRDKQQFVDKLLVITNSSLGDTVDEVRQSLEYLKKYNVLELNNDETNTVDAKYINVALDEGQVEVLKKALSNDIHKIAKVPDLTDSNFASNVSGIAMAYKLFGTEQLAGEKEREFKKLLRQRFKIINNVLSLRGQGLDLYSISIRMKRNVPDNLDDKLKELQGTEGILSLRTRLQRYDEEIDVEEELKRLQEEKQQNMQMMANAYDNYDYKQDKNNNNNDNKQDDKAEQEDNNNDK